MAFPRKEVSQGGCGVAKLLLDPKSCQWPPLALRVRIACLQYITFYAYVNTDKAIRKLRSHRDQVLAKIFKDPYGYDDERRSPLAAKKTLSPCCQKDALPLLPKRRSPLAAKKMFYGGFETNVQRQGLIPNNYSLFPGAFCLLCFKEIMGWNFRGYETGSVAQCNTFQ
jgi:hypothetical protein